MKDLFLFSSLLDASHTFSYFFHIGLVALIAVIVAMMATRSMQLVPRGMQN
ncbi:F0F1 ATP synthase subunit A, partial [Campylobacter jejuni]